jgi:ribosomal protein S12 methylthiotransferase accessory factor
MNYEITLKDAFKTFTDDQDKIIAPDQTLKNVKEKFARLDLSILDETVRIDNGRLDIPVYFSVCGEDAARLTGTSKQMGKGATPVQAETSAVMELVERYSFYNYYNTQQNFIIGTYDQLKDQAMSFEVIAKSVHDTTDDLAKTRDFFSSIPMKWTWGYNLATQKKILVPFDWFFAINEFNGTSAGNCVEEALCQGICEIVERHVSAIVCREKKMIPGINPESATDPAVIRMLEKYNKAGINLYVSDFTLDMGIPTVGVMAFDPSTFPDLDYLIYIGCH